MGREARQEGCRRPWPPRPLPPPAPPAPADPQKRAARAPAGRCPGSLCGGAGGGGPSWPPGGPTAKTELLAQRWLRPGGGVSSGPRGVGGCAGSAARCRDPQTGQGPWRGRAPPKEGAPGVQMAAGSTPLAVTPAPLSSRCLGMEGGVPRAQTPAPMSSQLRSARASDLSCPPECPRGPDAGGHDLHHQQHLRPGPGPGRAQENWRHLSPLPCGWACAPRRPAPWPAQPLLPLGQGPWGRSSGGSHAGPTGIHWLRLSVSAHPGATWGWGALRLGASLLPPWRTCDPVPSRVWGSDLCSSCHRRGDVGPVV